MEETEEAARLALTKLFASKLKERQERRENLMPAVAATLDVLQIALDVYGQLSCWIMAEDKKLSDAEAAETLMANLNDVAKVTIRDRIAELRRIGRSIDSGEN